MAEDHYSGNPPFICPTLRIDIGERQGIICSDTNRTGSDPDPVREEQVRISRRMGLAALGLALLAVGASATPAGASTGAKQVRTGSVTQGLPVPAGFASWTDLLRVQEKMNAAADRIVTTARKGATDSGFASVGAAPENPALRAYP